MIDLTKPLQRKIRQDFLNNVLDAVDRSNLDINDISLNDLSSLPLDQLEKLMNDMDNDAQNISPNVFDTVDIGALKNGDRLGGGKPGEHIVPKEKWWIEKDGKGQEKPPIFEQGEEFQKILVSPYYLVIYVMRSIKRHQLTPEKEMVPFLNMVFKVFGLVGLASILLLIYDLNFIVNAKQLVTSTLIISAVAKAASTVLHSKYNPDEISEIEEGYLDQGEVDIDDEYEEDADEDTEDDILDDDIDYGDEEYYLDDYIGEIDSNDEGYELSKKKKEYSEELPLKEHIISTKLSTDEFNNNLLKAFNNSARFRTKDLVGREDIILSMNEYILCNNPGFSQLSSIKKGEIVYNNINFLIYEGLRGVYPQLTYTGEYTMEVQSVVENQMYYKVEVILPKIIKLDRITKEIYILESKFKAFEADNEVEMSVSMYGNTFVFRVKKPVSTVVTWADAIRYYDPLSGIKTYNQFIDEDKYDFPIMVGLQNDETPIIFDLSENTNIAVAGTSGSGKSWAVFLLIYNIIIQCHPGDANFVIFDFKGDAQYEAMARLPHVVGLFNHKDNPEMYIEYLKEVLAEMNRRSQILNELSVTKWSELRKSLKDDPDEMHKYPWLFVVMEETAAVLSSLESASTKTELKDEYIRTTKEIAKQCRSLGIRIIMISQRTTANDLPKDIVSECGVKFTFKLAEADLARVEMLPAGVIPPRKKGTAVFKEEFLTEPIVIKSLGIGGMNDLQIQNLTRMLALEWHLRVTDEELLNKYPLFKLVDNRMARREKVMRDLEANDLFVDPRKSKEKLMKNIEDSKNQGNPRVPNNIKISVGNSNEPIKEIETVEIKKTTKVQVNQKAIEIELNNKIKDPDIFDLDDLYNDVEEVIEEEYKEFDQYVQETVELPHIIDVEYTEEGEEPVEDVETTEISEEAQKIIKRVQTKPITMMGYGRNTQGNKPTERTMKNDTKVPEDKLIIVEPEVVEDITEPKPHRQENSNKQIDTYKTPTNTNNQQEIKKHHNIVEFMKLYGEPTIGAYKVPHNLLKKYYTAEEITNALNNIDIVDLDGNYLA